MMAPLQGFKSILRDNDPQAKFKESQHLRIHHMYGCYHSSIQPTFEAISSFQHNIDLRASVPFAVKEYVPEFGPYAGQQCFVVVKATYFPFVRLPAELRQEIYKLLFPSQKPVNLAGRHWVSASDRHSRPATPITSSIIVVNRAIYAESIGFVYRPRHFVSPGITMANSWLHRIGSSRQYVTSLTIEKTGHLQIQECYSYLCDATRLKYLKITLPGSMKGTLAEHVDAHWADLSIYLLSRGADLAKSLRRLDAVHFDIGPAMKGVLSDCGHPLREMTPEREEWCKRRIRAKLRKHFEANPSRGLAGSARAVPSGREVIELDG